MKLTIEGPPEPGARPARLRARLVRFALLWLGSLAAIAGAAYALRALLPG